MSGPGIPREYQNLHAEWYELVSDRMDHAEEIAFWERKTVEVGEPVLELGCGTGRVLIPLLERGIDIVGIDTSKPMMERCRARCASGNLRPELYEQSMLSLDLDRRFALVMLTSGGLGLFISDSDIRQVFERVEAHLRDGGCFIFEFELEPDQPPASRSWSDRITTGDGSDLFWTVRRKYDRKTKVWESTFVLEKSTDGRLVEREVNERVGRYFTPDEAVRFAESAGLHNITVTDWLERGPIDANSKVATVHAFKPL